MYNKCLKRLDTMFMASKMQKLAKPFLDNGKKLTYIYYSIILKRDDLAPITITRFYRYMRIDTRNYEELHAEFVAQQFEKMETECRRRNKKRREAKRKALFGTSAADTGRQTAPRAAEAESCTGIKEPVGQL